MSSRLSRNERLKIATDLAKRLRKAVRLKCKDCIYDPMDHGAGTWMKQIENCAYRDCPLWPVRTGQYIDSGANQASIFEERNGLESPEQGVPGTPLPGGCSDQPENGLFGPANGVGGQILAACEVSAHG